MSYDQNKKLVRDVLKLTGVIIFHLSESKCIHDIKQIVSEALNYDTENENRREFFTGGLSGRRTTSHLSRFEPTGTNRGDRIKYNKKA